MTTPFAPGVCVAQARLDALGEDESLASLLTPRELARMSDVPRARRRREYLTSRVLAKYAFLAGPSMGEPSLREIDARDLGRFSDETYRDVEIVRTSLTAGPSRLAWRGDECRDVHLSIAHAAGCVAVGVSARGPIGIDVAAIDGREPAFYRVQFTPREHGWVALSAATATPTLYTLLWTLKESIVKTGAAPHVTLWGYDEIEVLVDAPSCVVADAFRHEGVFTRVGMTVPLATGARVRDAWFSRLSNSLLSFVTLELSAA